MNDAPYGHIAVKPEIDSNGDAVCDDCAFDDDRAYSFDGFGELTNARGIFLNRPEFASTHVDDHRDFARALPRNVRSVSSLDEVLT
jgi:hypothetical protein